jgi:hypothetical protein
LWCDDDELDFLEHGLDLEEELEELESVVMSHDLLDEDDDVVQPQQSLVLTLQVFELDEHVSSDSHDDKSCTITCNLHLLSSQFGLLLEFLYIVGIIYYTLENILFLNKCFHL